MKQKLIALTLIFLSFQLTIFSARIYPKTDDSTLSNFSEVVAEHYVLDFDIDFTTKK